MKRPKWDLESSKNHDQWQGLEFSHVQMPFINGWAWINGAQNLCPQSKTEIPLANGGSLTTGLSVDIDVGFWSWSSSQTTLAYSYVFYVTRWIIYRMLSFLRPYHRIFYGPRQHTCPSFECLYPNFFPASFRGQRWRRSCILLGKENAFVGKTLRLIGRSKALDSLARMIASTESFFLPKNEGDWTTDVSCLMVCRCSCFINTYLQLSAFIKYIVFDFNKCSTCFGQLFYLNYYRTAWRTETWLQDTYRAWLLCYGILLILLV